MLVHPAVRGIACVSRELMNNPDAMRQMLSPENMQAMMQMQQAMQRLQGTGLIPPAAGNGSMAGQPCPLPQTLTPLLFSQDVLVLANLPY